MDIVDIDVPDTITASDVESAVVSVGEALELRVSLRGTLASYPGCTHWHFKRGKQSGTLEVTWWPEKRRLWISVQAGRRAEWIDETMGLLAERLRKELR